MKKFYGQFEPSVDRFIFERYFPDEGIKGVFVECGAFDGLTECSCKFFEESMGWTGYNLEPVPWIFDKLCANRPESTNLNFALSNHAGDAVFHAVDHPVYGVECTNGSLAHTEKHSEWLQEAGCKIVDVPVRLNTWRDFVQEQKLTHIDLFVLDVEGHELSVIEGMSGCSVLPDIICIEIGHLSFSDIRVALGKLGYIYDISSHVNAFFVKESRLSLFALRRARKADIFEPPVEPVREVVDVVASEKEDLKQKVSTLESEIESLKMNNSILSDNLNEIVGSKAWKFVEMYRRLRS